MWQKHRQCEIRNQSAIRCLFVLRLLSVCAAACVWHFDLDCCVASPLIIIKWQRGEAKVKSNNGSKVKINDISSIRCVVNFAIFTSFCCAWAYLGNVRCHNHHSDENHFCSTSIKVVDVVIMVLLTPKELSRHVWWRENESKWIRLMPK